MLERRAQGEQRQQRGGVLTVCSPATEQHLLLWHVRAAMLSWAPEAGVGSNPQKTQERL